MKNRIVLWSSVGLLLLACGGYAYKLWSDHAVRADALQKLCDDVDTVLGADHLDNDELSRLVTRLDAADATDRRVPLMLARIDLARGRYERASRQLDPLLAGRTEPAALRTAAITWQLWHARGSSASDRADLGRRALRFAEDAYAATGEAEDLFRVYQAASRAGDDAAAQKHLDELTTKFAESLPGRVAARLVDKAGLAQPLAPVAQLIDEWHGEPPAELLLLRATLELQQNDIARAAEHLSAVLTSAPNLVEVRNMAAVAYHALFLAAEGGERDRLRRRRDEQLTWLDGNAAPGDSRRVRWLEMQQQR
jgi:tetratricopeptide (TPR) repeat protein